MLSEAANAQGSLGVEVQVFTFKIQTTTGFSGVDAQSAHSIHPQNEALSHSNMFVRITFSGTEESKVDPMHPRDGCFSYFLVYPRE